MNIRSLGVSEAGHVRLNNEDAILADDTRGLWLVADGMGGHAAGEIASQLAIDTVLAEIDKGVALIPAIEQAQQTILADVEQHPERKGMGSTLVAVRLRRSRLELAWVGDSRVYQWQEGGQRQDSDFTPLSVDHSYVQDMVLRGVLTEDEAQHHPQRNLVRQALGMKLACIKIDSRRVYPSRAGGLLLCSDGVSDMLSRSQLANILTQDISLQDKLESLRQAVLNTEAADNFSAIVISYEPSVTHRLTNRLVNCLFKYD